MEDDVVGVPQVNNIQEREIHIDPKLHRGLTACGWGYGSDGTHCRSDQRNAQILDEE